MVRKTLLDLFVTNQCFRFCFPIVEPTWGPGRLRMVSIRNQTFEPDFEEVFAGFALNLFFRLQRSRVEERPQA